MSQTKARESVPLCTLEHAEQFMAKLSKKHREVLKTCVDGEVVALGYNDVREGGAVWNKALVQAVTTIQARDVDLDELAFAQAEAESDYASARG